MRWDIITIKPKIIRGLILDGRGLDVFFYSQFLLYLGMDLTSNKEKGNKLWEWKFHFPVDQSE